MAGSTRSLSAGAVGPTGINPTSLVAIGLKYAAASLASLTFLLVLIRVVPALLASTEQPAGEAANGVLRALHNLTGLVDGLTRNLTGRTRDLPHGVLHLIEGSSAALLGFLFLLVLPFLYFVCHFVLLLPH
jgi:hypothetical protein